MKTLKPGKVEQRKFVCPNCECEFVIYKSESARSMDLDGNYHYWAQCPCRDSIAWDKGEPYEEPAPTQTDRERDLGKLRGLIHEWRCDSTNLTPLDVYLLENGVTFREDTT